MAQTYKLPDFVFVIFCDGQREPDQACYSEREAKREKRDLEAMGFEVRIRKMPLAAADAKGWL